MQTYNRDPEDVLIDCIEIVYKKLNEYPVHCEVHGVLKGIIDEFGNIETWKITR